MSFRRGVAALAAVSGLALGAGCAEMRGNESIGGYVDDDSITTTVKTRLVEDKSVDAAAIQVETAQGNVVLAGVARSEIEKITVESIAIKVRGVKTVQNNIAVRP